MRTQLITLLPVLLLLIGFIGGFITLFFAERRILHFARKYLLGLHFSLRSSRIYDYRDLTFPVGSVVIGAIALIALNASKIYPIHGHVDNYIQILIGYATFLVIFYNAYVGDAAKDRRKALPKVELNFFEPDCHLTLTGGTIPTYFARFRVKNNGHSSIQNAEVIVEKILMHNEPLTSFMPLNLTWALTEHQGNRALVQIPQGMFRTADFIEIMEPSRTSSLAINLSHESPPRDFEAHMYDNLSKGMAVCSVVKPNTLSHILSPGEYIFYLSIVSDNIAPWFAKIQVIYDGTWNDDVAVFFGQNLKVKLLEQGENKIEIFD